MWTPVTLDPPFRHFLAGRFSVLTTAGRAAPPWFVPSGWSADFPLRRGPVVLRGVPGSCYGYVNPEAAFGALLRLGHHPEAPL